MRPIGYWLKEIDRLLEDGFTRLLAEENFTRRHWQVLNTLAGKPTGPAELDAALAPFQATVVPVVDELAARGWVRRDDATLELTAAGTAAHDDLGRRVRAHRAAVTEGVTAEEYATVLRVLERIAANLTGQLGIRSPRRVVSGP